ncbi:MULTISPECIES: hypothetical protein [unclassified Enterococcus]|uniref:hypothetical protein n=1 Tax=unclassified Enterococcus TaxID=2608891 RepID=UPI0013EB3DB2|nr:MULTISPECIES: hypothetical protein [unclassified Enterococcus]
MDKRLYYRVMGPTAFLATLVLFLPNLSIRSLIGFLIMFSGWGTYYYLMHKKEKMQPAYMKTTRRSEKDAN